MKIFFKKIYSYNIGFIDYMDKITNRIVKIPTNVMILIGLFLILVGFGISIYSLITWQSLSFGDLEPAKFMLKVIPANILLVLGTEILGSSILINTMSIKYK